MQMRFASGLPHASICHGDVVGPSRFIHVEQSRDARARRPRTTFRPRPDGTAAWSCAGSWRRFRFFLRRLGPDTPELNAEGVGLEQGERARVSFRSTEDRRKSRAFATDRAHLGCLFMKQIHNPV